MVARVNTVAFQGIDVIDVDVQVQISAGLPAFSVVGLADKAVAESRERVRGALNALGLALPPKRITVNLAPADLAKEGSHFDLPIALGLLTAMEVLPAEEMMNFIAMGELALDGRITAVAGALPTAIHADARDMGLICPEAGGGEAAWVKGLEVLAPGALLNLINHFKGTQMLAQPVPLAQAEAPGAPDLADIKGQESAKRALEVAAAGGHNLLMSGPPGAGKSMLAARVPGILPPLTPAEALEVSMIHSLAGTLADGRILRRRPFRDPHHSASLPALIGGGPRARPGEVSLAHLGVLFLDELPEFAGIRQQTHLKSYQTFPLDSICLGMADPHVLTGLIKKRAELAGEIEAAQSRLRMLVIDLDHLDATIRLFKPDIDLEDIRPKPLPPQHHAFKGEVTRIVLDTLRQSTKPMTTNELAQHVMAERGLNTADKKLVRVIGKRVGACLRHWRARGTVTARKGPGPYQVWEIVRPNG